MTSPAFEADRPIPPRFAAEGENISPPLAWQGAPESTRAFVVLVEDPAVERDPPFVHWILANVPAEVTELAQGVPGAPKLRLPEDALQGVNSKGSTGWTGMHPPADDPPHPYHVQVFALDGKLDLPPGAGRTEVLAAMEGRVLAAGQLVGTYGR